MRDWVQDRWDFFFALSAGAWSALAAWFAVVAALIAGAIAYRQLKVAQTLRKEQAQPNVVVFMEPTKDHWGHIDLVVKNFGATPAYDVHLGFSPELNVAPVRTTTGELLTKLAHPDVIPFLAPGQEWRSVWDYSKRRFEADKKTARDNESRPAADRLPPLTARFDARLTFKDSDGGRFETDSILDWGHLNTKMVIDTKTVHDVARTLDKQLKEANKKLGKVEEAVSALSDEHTGVWIYQGDVQELRAYYADQAERARERHEEVMQMLGMLDPSQTEVQPARGEPNPPADPAPAESARSEGE